MTTLERAVLSSLRVAGVGPGSLLLVAVSGGPDSTALLCALASLRAAARIHLAACTILHGLRPDDETTADAAFVQHLCGDLDVPLAVLRIPHGQCAARARAEKRSLEEIAREARHALLRAEAARSVADAVALGHTRDDVLETLLMRVLQGSDPEGLAEQGVRTGLLVRPLLGVTRAEVMAYLADTRQEWREDPTNSDERFLRNHVRHSLVPVLDESFPGWRTGLLALSQKVGLAAAAVAGEARSLPWRPEQGGFRIEYGPFAAAAPAARVRSLMNLYDRFRPPGSPRRLPWRFVSPVAVDVLPARLTLRGHGVLLESRVDSAWWGPDIASHVEKGYFIEVPLQGTIAAGEAGLRICLARAAAEPAAVPGVVSLREEDVAPPLVLRSRRRGDEVRLESGVHSVKELFDAWQVPEQTRERVPLLSDRGGVLAVLGGVHGYATIVREGADGESRGGGTRITVRVERDREGGNRSAPGAAGGT